MNPHGTSNKSWVVRMPVDKETHLIGIIETNAWLLAWHLYVTFLKGINYSIRLIFSYSKTSCFTFTEGISMTHNSYLQDSKTTCFTSRDDRGTGRGDMVFLRKGWFDGPSCVPLVASERSSSATNSRTVRDGLRDRGKWRSPGALLLQGFV